MSQWQLVIYLRCGQKGTIERLLPYVGVKWDDLEGVCQPNWKVSIELHVEVKAIPKPREFLQDERTGEESEESSNLTSCHVDRKILRAKEKWSSCVWQHRLVLVRTSHELSGARYVDPHSQPRAL